MSPTPSHVSLLRALVFSFGLWDDNRICSVSDPMGERTLQGDVQEFDMLIPPHRGVSWPAVRVADVQRSACKKNAHWLSKDGCSIQKNAYVQLQ